MNAWTLTAVALLAVLVLIVSGRRRAARRAAEAEARARARRRQLPLVSSNVRGRTNPSQDLWEEDAGGFTVSDPARR
jgi:hypothetical protein